VTVPTDVDRAAPVIAVHEIDIEAPLDTVWPLHTDIGAWPKWQTGITGVHEWLFSEMPGGVRVTTTESFAGEPVEDDVPGMQTILDASLLAWLGHLKVAAESLA
jgi:hypothetical protein